MVAQFHRRVAASAAVGLLLLALSAACSGSQSVGDKQQVADLQATLAALQSKLAQTPPAATPTVVANPIAAAAPIKSLTPIVGTPRSLLIASPPRIGIPIPVQTESGEQLDVTVNAIIDPATSTHPYNKAKGRWVVVDWTITNRGSIGHRVSIYACLLQTADGYVVNVGNAAGLPTPELISSTLGPGQTVRGFVPYDVAAGAKLKSAIYQPLGNRQFVIADLTQ